MKYSFNDFTIRELYTRSMDFDPGQEWLDHWNKMTSDEKQLVWNSLSQDLDEVEVEKLEMLVDKHTESVYDNVVNGENNALQLSNHPTYL